MTTDSNPAEKSIQTSSLVMRLLVMTAGMFGFGFLLVPLYSVFCNLTGFGGRTNETPAAIAENTDKSRNIDLELVTTVNDYAPWVFKAVSHGMKIHPGGLYEVQFMAHNLSGRTKVAQAVPGIAPSVAAKYFKKLDCFCFTTQKFAPEEQRDLYVRFIVDPDVPDYVDTITLSYTFFDTARPGSEDVTAAQPTLSHQ